MYLFTWLHNVPPTIPADELWLFHFVKLHVFYYSNMHQVLACGNFIHLQENYLEAGFFPTVASMTQTGFIWIKDKLLFWYVLCDNLN